MALFIKFKNTDYSIPNSSILGRGAPFLSEDHSFERKHVLISKKKDLIRVKDVSKKSKVLLDGKELPKKKWVTLNVGQSLSLGGEVFQIIDESSAMSPVKVSGFSSNSMAVRSKPIIIYLIIASPLFLYISGYLKPVIALFVSNQNFVDVVSGILFALSILGAFIYTTYMLYFSFSRNTYMDKLVTQFIMDLNGFTIHYKNGSNFSIQNVDVVEWSHSGGVYVFRTKQDSITAYFEHNSENTKKLLGAFNKKMGSKFKKRNKILNTFFRLAPIFVLTSIYILLEASPLANIQYLSLVTLFLGISILSVLFSKDLKSSFYYYDRNDKNLYKQKAFVVVTFVVSLFSVPLYFEHSSSSSKNVASFTRCLDAYDSDGCKGIDLRYIDDSFQANHPNMSLVFQKMCSEHKMEQACSRIRRLERQSKRDIASQK